LIQIIESEHVDKKKWNELARKSNVSFQNFSLFLDTIPENWCAVVWDDYRGGIAIPYTVRMGIKGMFNPPMTSPLSWLGEKPDNFAEINLILQKKFKRSNLTTYEQLFPNSQQLLYQRINYTPDYKITKGNTRRSIYKFEHSDLIIQKMEIERVLAFIVSELRLKMPVLTHKFVDNLQKFLYECGNQCHCFGVKNVKTETLHAGLILIESDSEITDLYSATDIFGRKNHTMYALIFHAISLAMGKKKDFNFGGSTIDSIRYFNHRFGAKDAFYYSWKWERSPWWFRIMMLLKNCYNRKQIATQTSLLTKNTIRHGTNDGFFILGN